MPLFCHDTTGVLPAKGVEAAYNFVRKTIPHLGKDRDLSLDIEKAAAMITSSELIDTVENAIGRLN